MAPVAVAFQRSAPAAGTRARATASRASHGVLAMQRLAGNRAVAGLIAARGGPTIQRACACGGGCGTCQSDTAGDDQRAERSAPVQRLAVQRIHEAPALTQALLADSPVLQQAFHNAPTLKKGHPKKGTPEADAVRRVQQALVMGGFDMTNSMKSGVPDEDYGPETQRALFKLQEREDIRPPSGVEVGHRTLIALDDIVAGGAKPTNSTVTVPNTFGKSSQDAKEDGKGKLIQKPGGQPTVNGAKEVEAEGDDDGVLQGTAQINWGALWNVNPLLKTDGTKDFGGFGNFCGTGSLQGGLKLNLAGFKAGDRWTLFSSFELDVNAAPAFCGKLPAVQAQLEVLKLELSKMVEISLMGITGAQGPPRGGLLGGSLEIDVKPFGKTPVLKNLKIVGNANAFYFWQASGPEDQKGRTPQLGGTIGIGGEWDIIPAKKK